MVYLFKMVIFYSYVSHYQRVCVTALCRSRTSQKYDDVLKNYIPNVPQVLMTLLIFLLNFPYNSCSIPFYMWFIRGKLIKMDDLGVPPFMETPIYIRI